MDFSSLTWFPSVQAWAEVDGLPLNLLLAFIYPGLIFLYGPIERMTCSLHFEQGLLTTFTLMESAWTLLSCYALLNILKEI